MVSTTYLAKTLTVSLIFSLLLVPAFKFRINCNFTDEIQMPQASPERSRVGSPEDNGSRQSPSRSGANGGGGRIAHPQVEEEVCTLYLIAMVQIFKRKNSFSFN